MKLALLLLLALLFLSNTHGDVRRIRRVGQEIAGNYVPNHDHLQYPPFGEHQHGQLKNESGAVSANHLGEHQRRQLENDTETSEVTADSATIAEGAKNEDVEENEDEDLPSCNDVLLHETIHDRCHHAKNCEGEYIMTTLLPLAFCNDPSTTSPLDSHPILIKFFPILFPISLILLTLLLFCLLGSTAENYFSPALEMISSEFHIVSVLLCNSQHHDVFRFSPWH